MHAQPSFFAPAITLEIRRQLAKISALHVSRASDVEKSSPEGNLRMLAGLGMGCVFAPMTTVAMRDVAPRDTGAASGVFNTMRQLGAVVGSAIIGAVLQAQLAVDLPAQASTAAAQLPAPFRDQFVSGFAQAARAGFQVGVGQTGGAQLPPNLPGQVVVQIQAIARQVFELAFIDAMRPTAVVAIVVLLVAAASCVFIATVRRPRAVSEAVIVAAAD